MSSEILNLCVCSTYFFLQPANIPQLNAQTRTNRKEIEMWHAFSYALRLEAGFVAANESLSRILGKKWRDFIENQVDRVEEVPNSSSSSVWCDFKLM